MLHLHANEYRLHDKTANWAEIEAGYMRHCIAMQRENDGLCLVAYVDGDPAGFMFGFTQQQDDSRFEIGEEPELYISDGYVTEKYRRKGIYRHLNTHMEQHFIPKGIKRVIRLTLLVNTGMRQMLEAGGYSPTRIMYEKWL